MYVIIIQIPHILKNKHSLNFLYELIEYIMYDMRIRLWKELIINNLNIIKLISNELNSNYYQLEKIFLRLIDLAKEPKEQSIVISFLKPYFKILSETKLGLIILSYITKLFHEENKFSLYSFIYDNLIEILQYKSNSGKTLIKYFFIATRKYDKKFKLDFFTKFNPFIDSIILNKETFPIIKYSIEYWMFEQHIIENINNFRMISCVFSGYNLLSLFLTKKMYFSLANKILSMNCLDFIFMIENDLGFNFLCVITFI